jgi:hypothetical protein
MQPFKIVIPCVVSGVIAFFLVRDPFNFQFGVEMIYFYSSIPFGWYVLNRLLDRYYRPPIVFITIEAAIILRIIKSFVKFFVSMLLGFIVAPFVVIYGLYRLIKC